MVYCSALALLVEGFEQGVKRKTSVIAAFVEAFKVPILRGSHSKVLTVLWVTPLKVTLP